ncbi:MAG: glycosyltransferase family 2 protein [Candidatus Helarchaeota archaeon]
MNKKGDTKSHKRNHFPKVSIIIVNYNGKHYLKDCLASIENLYYPKNKLETIVVDNNSKDGSIKFIKNNYKWVKIIKLNKNFGFCTPNNIGARKASGKYLVLLNNDTVVTPFWLYELTNYLDKDIISCACKILYYDNKKIINTAGGKISIIGGGFYRGYGDKSSKYKNFDFVGFGSGAGVLIEKEFFINKMKGFDDDYFASCEEHDLGWKVWMYGYKVLYIPSAVMFHKESGTFGSKGSYHPLKAYLITRNRLYNITKNFEPQNLVKGIIIHIGFSIYRSFKMLKLNKIKVIKYITLGYISYIKNFLKTINKRKYINKNRVRSDKKLYKLGVIAPLNECIKEELRITKLLETEFYS